MPLLASKTRSSVFRTTQEHYCAAARRVVAPTNQPRQSWSGHTRAQSPQTPHPPNAYSPLAPAEYPGTNTTADIHKTPEAAHSHSRLVRKRKGTRMQHKHRGRRVGKVMRWGVYVCTLIMVLLCVASYWPEPMVSREVVPKRGSNQPRSYFEVVIASGSIVIDRYPDYRQMGFSSPEPGTHTVFMLHSSHFPPTSPRVWSWPQLNLSGGGSGGQYTRFAMHTLLPSLILLGVSVALAVRASKCRAPGGCPHCGYSLEGLTTETCPECGGTTTTSS